MAWRILLVWLLSVRLALAYLPLADHRLTGLTFPAGAFAYTHGFQPASSLVTGIHLPNDATITNGYDSQARLTLTALNNYWGHPLDGQAYQYDPLGLKTNIARYFGLGTNSVAVGYDAIGQLQSWAATEASGQPRLNEQLQFVFDQAHNLHARYSGALTMEQVFWCDAANQLTNEVLDGGMLIAGNTTWPATNFSVGTQPGQVYSDLTFACTNAPWNPEDGAYDFYLKFRTGLGALLPYGNSPPPPSVTLQYDADGNLTNDGTRSFAYSVENQMTNVQVAGSWRTDFVYDGLGRRRIERDFAWQSGSWSKTNELHFIYDGWLLVQVRDINNNVLVTYTRGLDLSGTRTGAGGIGGLLARTDANGSTFYHADGEGNVMALIDGQEDIVARYLYDPFGRVLGQWGSLAPVNTMQFSSMPFHVPSGLSLSPFRAYDPVLSRFLNQDPIGESGGINLYGFVRNSPMNFVDPYGLDFHSAGASGLLPPGPLSYMSGDTTAENAVASVVNTVPAAANLVADVAGAVFGALDWVANQTGLTGVLGASPSDVAQGINPMSLYPGGDLNPSLPVTPSEAGAATDAAGKAGNAGADAAKAAGDAAKAAPKCKGLKYANKALNNKDRIAYVYNNKTGDLAFAAHHGDASDLIGSVRPGDDVVYGEYVNGDPLNYTGSQAAQDAATRAVISALEPK